MAPREKPIVIDGGDKLVIDRPREGPAVIGGHLLIVTLVEGDRLRGQFERRVSSSSEHETKEKAHMAHMA